MVQVGEEPQRRRGSGIELMKIVQLSLDPKKVPRTTTREGWRKQHRYMRILDRMVNAEMEKHREEIQQRFMNVLLYGTSHPECYLN